MFQSNKQRSENGSLFYPIEKTDDMKVTALSMIKRAIMAPCRKNTDHGISPTGKLVLIVLTSLADDTGQCSPSMKELAEITGYSRVAIVQNIAQLEKSGFILRTQSIGFSNTYRLNHSRWPVAIQGNAA